MLSKSEFGSEAIPYIESCLYKGKTLSHCILRKHRIEQRKEIFAYLPPETTLEQKIRFLEGRIIREPGSNLKIAKFIAEFLTNDDSCYVIFEHPLAAPGDPWLKNANIKFISHKSEVYLFLTSDDTNLDVIQNTLSKIGSYPSIGILTALSPNIRKLRDQQEVGDSVLENLVEQLQYIIVGAYDEETMLFWRRG